jgi:hypothetical protein
VDSTVGADPSSLHSRSTTVSTMSLEADVADQA